MNLSDYTFVAIDLETTGLDPHKDTIIEVAAVRFRLERDGDTFRAIDQEERSMLIDPGRKLEENIAMITGISDAMLSGKKKWDEVREKVRNFIGESIIVGHNVLFDIAMLATHGIDLHGSSDDLAIPPSRHPTILDTFELSEIFSQDAESLNLGFLAKKYKIEMEGEHRALGDTRLSIELFLIYMGMIARLSDREWSIWELARTRDVSGTFEMLLSLSGEKKTVPSYTFPSLDLSSVTDLKGKDTLGGGSDLGPVFVNLLGTPEEERELIRSLDPEKKKVLIITPNMREAHTQVMRMQSLGYSVSLSRSIGEYCSYRAIRDSLDLEKWERKEAIFLVKILTWLDRTSTGLIDELKYYGEERDMIEIFRSRGDGESPFFIQQRRREMLDDLVIASLSQVDIEKRPIIIGDHTTLIRDIVWCEDSLRRNTSIHISTSQIYESLDILSESAISDTIIWGDILTGVSILIDTVISTARKSGEKESEKTSGYDESYLIGQESLWNRGEKWLILGSYGLIRGISFLSEKADSVTGRERFFLSRLIQSLDILISLIHVKDENLSTVVTIRAEDDISLSRIPRSIKHTLSEVIRVQCHEAPICTGYGIGCESIQSFLRHECGLIGTIASNPTPTKLKIIPALRIKERKTLILTTSMKHIRLLARELRDSYPHHAIYAQGLSGGKGKMKALFENEKKPSILIGLIDSWSDESSIWNSVEAVIITKIPFDPPTDPYFLARTVGMKNNFEEYSTPITLSKINTLIGRAHSVNPNIILLCSDERLNTMSWGVSLRKAIL